MDLNSVLCSENACSCSVFCSDLNVLKLGRTRVRPERVQCSVFGVLFEICSGVFLSVFCSDQKCDFVRVRVRNVRVRVGVLFGDSNVCVQVSSEPPGYSLVE